MSDRETHEMDAAIEAHMINLGEDAHARVVEDLDNDLFRTKDDLKKAGWNANRLKREKAKKQQQIAALQQDILDIENELAGHKAGEKARGAGFAKTNKERQKTSDALTAEIVEHLTPLRKEGLKSKVLIGDVMAKFGCGESKFWKAWGLTPKK